MSGSDRLENVNPVVIGKVKERDVKKEEEDDEICDEFDAREIFGEINNIVIEGLRES